jgi:hypothetical protein
MQLMSVATQRHIQFEFKKGMCSLAASSTSLKRARTTNGLDRGKDDLSLLVIPMVYV